MRQVEVHDPAAAEKTVREVLKDETDCPFFKLGLIQALRYRKPQVR